jgi:hypothetical protein
MQIDVEIKPRLDSRSLCAGSSQPVLSDTVNMNGQTAVRDTAICPDCGQRVIVWLSGPVEPTEKLGQWIRDPHPEPNDARP